MSTHSVYKRAMDTKTDQDSGVTAYSAQCLVRDCSCGNMIFGDYVSRNIHMDDCFKGRYECIGCSAIFHNPFNADDHCHYECRDSDGVEILDPMPHWRKEMNRDFLLQPHPDDHLWLELGYGA
ncbi:hypothetical protein BC835DRAFT_1420820 [Cytidiella melzeri]|nr:hypothetical protein BC835DRAFT_1420820 [Cytidiella melzeri]